MIIAFEAENVAKIGTLNETMMLYHIHYWIKKNKANHKNFREGRYWTYNSYEAFKEFFPFLTPRQIRYALEKLRDNGFILTGNFNRIGFDKTMWYTLTNKGFNIFGESEADGYLECNSPFADNDWETGDTNTPDFPPSDNDVTSMGDIVSRSDIPQKKSKKEIKPSDNDVTSFDNFDSTSDKKALCNDIIVKPSDNDVRPIPDYNQIKNKNKQQQTELPLSDADATKAQEANFADAAMSIFIAKRFDDYNLCLKHGINPMTAALMMTKYGADTVHQYLVATADEVTSGHIKNPTGWFISAVQTGYEISRSLSNYSAMSELDIKAMEKSIVAQISQENSNGPPLTTDSPFYKYLKHQE